MIRLLHLLLLSCACASLFAAPVRRSEIVVVAPQVSCAAADRAYAAALAGHLRTWLREGGVAADLADDRLLEGVLKGRRLAYLVLFHTPGASELGAIKRFILRGGRVCAFYARSPELAALMGVQLGAYKKGRPGQFEQMVFTSPGPPGSPRRIVQSDAAIFTAWPVRGRSHCLAVWADGAGRGTGDAAVIAAPSGWWVTQVFSSGGDERAKACFALSLVGTVQPRLWNAAAHAARERQARLQAAAYAARQVRRPGEIHAVWDHTGLGLHPGDWPRTVRLLKATGVTDLFVNVAGAGFAHYPTTVVPGSAARAAYGDPLAACLASAHGTGLRVHAWILCFNATRATSSFKAELQRRGWRLKNRSGVLTEYLDPAKPAVRAHALAIVSDVARRYPVDGVQLDFVRWYEGAVKPANAAAVMTSFVAEARRRVKAARPRAWLTASVLASHPSCVTSVGQDWKRWIEGGLVDYAVPMNYVGDLNRYRNLLSRQATSRTLAAHLISGLGVSANESHLGPVQTIDQINLARRYGYAGVALFDLDYTLATEILPLLGRHM